MTERSNTSKTIKVMDQEDWNTDLLFLDPSSPGMTSRAIATKFEEEIIRLKTLCTHMDIRTLFL